MSGPNDNDEDDMGDGDEVGDTIPSPQSDPDPPIIPAGKAQLALVAAFAQVAAALGNLEDTAASIARALDATVAP